MPSVVQPLKIQSLVCWWALRLARRGLAFVLIFVRPLMRTARQPRFGLPEQFKFLVTWQSRLLCCERLL